MRSSKVIYMAGLVLVSGVMLVSLQLGQAATILALVLFVAFAIGYPVYRSLGSMIMIWWRFRPIQQLTTGRNSEAIRARFEARWNKGKHTPYNATVLSFLSYQQKNYSEAERYARIAQAELKQRGLYSKYLQWLNTDVAMRLYNALTQQNRLEEAAETLLEHIPYTNHSDVLRVTAAMSLYLGSHADRAREVLGDLRVDISDTLVRQIVIGGPNPQAESETDLREPSVRLMTAWLRYKLHGEDPGPILRQHANAVDSLMPLGESGHDTAYERRWREMCAEIRTLLANQTEAADQLRV